MGNLFTLDSVWVFCVNPLLEEKQMINTREMPEGDGHAIEIDFGHKLTFPALLRLNNK